MVVRLRDAMERPQVFDSGAPRGAEQHLEHRRGVDGDQRASRSARTASVGERLGATGVRSARRCLSSPPRGGGSCELAARYEALHGRIHGFNVSVAHAWAEQERQLDSCGSMTWERVLHQTVAPSTAPVWQVQAHQVSAAFGCACHQ